MICCMDKAVIVTHAMMVNKLWEVILLKHQQSQNLPVYFSKFLYILHMILLLISSFCLATLLL